MQRLARGILCIGLNSSWWWCCCCWLYFEEIVAGEWQSASSCNEFSHPGQREEWRSSWEMVMLKKMMLQVAMLVMLMLLMLMMMLVMVMQRWCIERLGLGSVIVDLAWIALITQSHLNHTPNPILPTSLYHSIIVQYVPLMNTTFVGCFKYIEEMVSSCNLLRSDELCRLKCASPSSHKDV